MNTPSSSLLCVFMHFNLWSLFLPQRTYITREIVATDGGNRSSSVELAVTITNVKNQPPQWEKDSYNVVIPENTVRDTPIVVRWSEDGFSGTCNLNWLKPFRKIANKQKKNLFKNTPAKMERPLRLEMMILLSGRLEPRLEGKSAFGKWEISVCPSLITLRTEMSLRIKAPNSSSEQVFLY